MSTLARILHHTFRFPMRSAISLSMAIVCTLLVLVLPGVTMQFIDVIIKQHRPDLILQTAAIGITESLLTIVFTVAMGLSMGTTAMVARRIGEHDPEGASRAAMQAMLKRLLTSRNPTR